jgi:hypothetical protein
MKFVKRVKNLLQDLQVLVWDQRAIVGNVRFTVFCGHADATEAPHTGFNDNTSDDSGNYRGALESKVSIANPARAVVFVVIPTLGPPISLEP